MSFPLIPNGRFDVFPPKIPPMMLELGPGPHLAETLVDDDFVTVQKTERLGPDDFVVCKVDADGRWVETAKHVDLLKEFARALQTDPDGGRVFASAAFRVFGGDEPPETMKVAGTHRPGDYILKALKWIWAQEDVNHPIEQGKQGRKMAGYRLQELLDGVEPKKVFLRADMKSIPPDLPRVKYARVDRAADGDEP